MPIKKGTKRTYFPKVREAREALAGRALEILESYLYTISSATAAGDFETAASSYRWLLEHMPIDPEGNTAIDGSIDKPKQVNGNTGPMIQIGFALGGMSKPKELAPAAIDAEVVKSENQSTNDKK